MEQTVHRPKIGIICGSGLAGLADKVEDHIILPYRKIPEFPVSTVQGHVGELVFGTLKGKSVMIMKGRLHGYEGYPLWKVGLPVRVMKLIGVQTIIVTNAAGGLNPEFNIGDIMVIKDHLNLPGMGGKNPLVGPNDERFGPRFPPLSSVYNRDYRQLALDAAGQLNCKNLMKEGVYAAVGGPNFETVAECKFLRNAGADAVGCMCRASYNTDTVDQTAIIYGFIRSGLLSILKVNQDEDCYTGQGKHFAPSLSPELATVHSNTEDEEFEGLKVLRMSTVPEVLMAAHCGIKVLGLSLITNKCALDYDILEEASHKEVLEAAQKHSLVIQDLVAAIVEKITVMCS